jgi:ABC-type amino acid transport substrate-binding protein
LLSLSFVLFAAWFTDVNLFLSEYPGLALSGFLSFFGSLTAAIPFLLDLFRIPADTFQIFLATSVINARFGSLLAAVHILVVAVLGTTALVKKISFNPFRIGRYLLITTLLLASTVIGLRTLFTFQLDHEFDGRQLVLDMDSFYPSVKSRFVEELPSMASGKEGVETVLQAVVSRDLLRVGVLPEKIPFSFQNSNKELVGFDIELIQRMARDLEVEVEFYPLELEQLATALSKGQVDVAVGGILVTPERAVETFFTRPYLEETLAFVVRDDLRDKFTSWEKIRSQGNLTVGAEDAPYYVREVLERAPSLNIQILPPGKDFFDPDMHLDVMIMPAESGSVLTLLHPQYTVVVPEDQLVKVPVAFAVGRNDLAWEMWLNTWIHLKEEDGTLETLYRHWILGLGAEERTPRWSIARNLLGWGMP